jgi:dolichol-phosphate mannosyltransferase
MPDISIVVPTFQESGNIAPLHARIAEVLDSMSWELIFVDDDSPDGTADIVRELAQQDPRVRCIQRLGRRGLSTAVVEGVMSSAAPVLVVMDADLQHEESILPEMLERLRSENLDIVIGSRYTEGGSTGEWSRRRLLISHIAGWLARGLIPDGLHDPMSGFFAVRAPLMRDAARRLSGYGYKILLDLFASAGRPLRFAEVAYTFKPRTHGASKLDTLVAWEYLMLLLDKRVGHIIPPRLVFFAMVGGSGVIVHYTVLTLVFQVAGLAFVFGQAGATIAAMTWNFLLNNVFTYRDRRLRGWRLLRGLLTFYAVCGIGALANVGIAAYTFARNQQWVLSAAAGILVGTMWNYLATARYTWGARRSSP